MSSLPDKKLITTQRIEILSLLEKRFHDFPQRHPGITWNEVKQKLDAFPDKLYTLFSMEQTGGQPDVVGKTKEGEYIFFDCSPESPDGRRNVCYDRKALDDRKTFKPSNSALDLAGELGITMLSEEDFRFLQTLGDFDTKTSSWLLTPEPIRKLGGALFGDKRYNHVFIYHNGASSYYAVRGFRGKLLV